jgi:hypothetical protein
MSSDQRVTFPTCELYLGSSFWVLHSLDRPGSLGSIFVTRWSAQKSRGKSKLVLGQPWGRKMARRRYPRHPV